MKIGIVVALVAALALPTAAGAATQPKVKKAYFNVTLEGIQRENWDNFHQETGGCDATVASKGSEVVRFRSRPVEIVATWVEGMKNAVLRKNVNDVQLYPFRLSGSITRNSSITVSDSPAHCGGTGGGSTPPKDCGTKRFRGLKASIDYSYVKPFERIQATSEGGLGNDPFKNCGAGTQGYPHLLSTKTDNWPIVSALPLSELFDKSLGKIIVLGRGQRVQKGDETYDKASIRWEATFVRIKP